MSARAAAAPAPEPPSTRDAILDAAERCFADRGFAGVSMREIAAEAGLRNQASLYHHFADKRALYEATLARGVAPIVALMEESGGGWLDPAEGERNGDPPLDSPAGDPHRRPPPPPPSRPPPGAPRFWGGGKETPAGGVWGPLPRPATLGALGPPPPPLPPGGGVPPPGMGPEGVSAQNHPLKKKGAPPRHT